MEITKHLPAHSSQHESSVSEEKGFDGSASTYISTDDWTVPSM